MADRIETEEEIEEDLEEELDDDDDGDFDDDDGDDDGGDDDDDEFDEDDDEISDEQAALIDGAVEELLEDGLITVGAGYELKFFIAKNDPSARKEINALFGEKNKRGFVRLRVIVDTIVTEKTIIIWYYE